MRQRNRRDFLSLAAGVAASTFLPWPSLAENPAHLSDLRDEFLVSLGNAYLSQVSPGLDPKQLRQSLGISESGAINTDQLRTQILGEFQNGDIVIVDGWHLSRSEARLYALLALE